MYGRNYIDEYRKHIERDAALEERFQPVMVGEPSIEDTIEILKVSVNVMNNIIVLKLPMMLGSCSSLGDRYILIVFAR